MLTEKDKEWLALRELRHFETGYYMPSFKHEGKTWHAFFVWTDWKAAAEFEARVAAKLVGELQYECVCPSCRCNTHGCRTARMSYKQCLLKHARLAVEAEMEENNE